MNRIGTSLVKSSAKFAFGMAAVNAVKMNAVSAPAMTVFVRNFGLVDTIKEKLTDASETKSKERDTTLFMSTRETLLATPAFRLKEYFAMLDSQMKHFDSFKGKVGSMLQKEDFEKLKRSYSIFSALTPVERAASSLNIINMAVKERVTAVTGANSQEINRELKKYEELLMLHTWFHSRVTRGLKLPATQSELMELMVNDKPKLTASSKRTMMKQQSGRFKSTLA